MPYGCLVGLLPQQLIGRACLSANDVCCCREKPQLGFETLHPDFLFNCTLFPQSNSFHHGKLINLLILWADIVRLGFRRKKIARLKRPFFDFEYHFYEERWLVYCEDGQCVPDFFSVIWLASKLQLHIKIKHWHELHIQFWGALWWVGFLVISQK